MNFFGAFTEEASAPDSTGGSAKPQAAEIALPSIEPWSNKIALDFEKEVLGFYVSSHPLDDHRDILARFTSCTLAEAKQLGDNTPVTVAGILTRVRPTFVKRGRSAGSKMAMLTLDDGKTSLDAVCFADTYATCYGSLETDRVVFLVGKLGRRSPEEDPSVRVDRVVPIERAAEALTQTVRIIVHDHTKDEQRSAFNGEFGRLREVLRQASHRGDGSGAPPADVVLELHQHGKQVSLRLPGVRVSVDENLAPSIVAVLRHVEHGDARCELLGPPKIKAPVGGLPAEMPGPGGGPAAPPRRLTFTSRLAEGEVCDSVDRY